MNLLFDIETGPLPDEQLDKMLYVFDPSEVKCGNMKDPEKIAQKLEEAEEEHYAKQRDKAALSAETGMVLAIGVSDGDGISILEGSEVDLLQKFWRLAEEATAMLGWNILSFDIPFLIRRSWMLGVDGWQCAVSRSNPNDALHRVTKWKFIDLMQWYGLGEYGYRISLDRACKALGMGQKNGHGKDFAKLYLNPETRVKAIKYLENDITLLCEVCRKIAPQFVELQ